MSRHLLVDIGNSRVKVAWLEAGGPSLQQPFAHAALNTALPDWIRDAAPVAGFHTWISNVAGDGALHRLADALAAWQPRLHPVHTSERFDQLINDYERPAGLGVDRWLGLLGAQAWAKRLYPDPPPPLLLAHFGTATTIDALDDSHFIGGLILPGVSLMLDALATGTAALPHAQGATLAFPRNTDDAIASGIAAAQAGAVLRQHTQLLQRTGRLPRVIVSGGALPAVEAELRSQLAGTGSTFPPHALDNPVLDGLARVAMLSPHYLP